MNKKIVFITIIFLILNQCGYSSLYKNIEDQKYNFEIISLDGDIKMNSIIKTTMNRYSNDNSKNKLKIKIFTRFSKDDLSKDKAGDTTQFIIKSRIEFQIINKDNKRIFFEEETKIKNINNKFELKEYEDSIKNNFVTSKIDEFIVKISTLK
ncbi:hypothetical protein [Candidatus Pelagibacter sp. HIMB1748]|uniref:hypothetical protein n=1 Tax=unclassified Candidatus Pelagibacter TaxID=2647897 RepID=UPI003F85369F